jgi:hypothetical protein
MTLEEANAEAKRRWGPKAEAWVVDFSGVQMFVIGIREFDIEQFSILPKSFGRRVEYTMANSFEKAFERVDKTLAKEAEAVALIENRQALEQRMYHLELEQRALEERWKQIIKGVSIYG